MLGTLFNFSHLVVTLPEIFMAISAMAVLMLGVVVDKPHANGVVEARNAYGLVNRFSIFILIVAAILCIDYVDSAPRYAFSFSYIVDPFAAILKIVAIIGAGLTLLMSRRFMHAEQLARFEYPVLVLFSVLGMMLMLSANDLLLMYVALELQSLPLYVMACWRRDSVKSTEAGVKYFVLGALSSGLLLFGMSYIYGHAGVLNFEDISAVLAADGANSPQVLVGIAFVLAGLCFKLAAAPFHMWSPDVYEGAPTPVTAFFAIVPKVAAVGLLIRLCYVALNPEYGAGEVAADAAWRQILIVVSILSMLVGAVAAIAQKNIKRLLAYSAIGHVGYALVGIVSASQLGVRGAVLYIIVYMLMSVGAFALVLALRRTEVDQPAKLLTDLSGIAKEKPVAAMCMAVLMFSMAGIPPMAGFFGKLFIFQAAIDAKLYMLAVFGVLMSVISAFYYLRIIKIMYFDDMLERTVLNPQGGEKVALGVSVLFVALFVFIASPILALSDHAAESMVKGYRSSPTTSLLAAPHSNS